jgi:hypothetical protein
MKVISTFEPPNLDRLAAEGMRFTQLDHVEFFWGFNEGETHLAINQMCNQSRDGMEMANCADNPEYKNIFESLNQQRKSGLDKSEANSS